MPIHNYIHKIGLALRIVPLLILRIYNRNNFPENMFEITRFKMFYKLLPKIFWEPQILLAYPTEVHSVKVSVKLFSDHMQ